MKIPMFSAFHSTYAKKNDVKTKSEPKTRIQHQGAEQHYESLVLRHVQCLLMGKSTNDCYVPVPSRALPGRPGLWLALGNWDQETSPEYR